MASDTDLLDLPDESLVKILQFLNYKDLCRFVKPKTYRVCQGVYSFIIPFLVLFVSSPVHQLFVSYLTSLSGPLGQARPGQGSITMT